MKRIAPVLAGLIIAITILFEVWFPENVWTAMLVWLGRSVIIAYSVHQMIIWMAGRAQDWLEAFSGVGGLLYIVGLHLWLVRDVGEGTADIDLFLRVIGVALMLLPRLWRVTKHALAG